MRAEFEFIARFLALRELRCLLESKRFTHVALPRLTTGAGGLDWKVVQPLIERHFGELKVPVYIYTQYEEGVQAIEPGLSLCGGVEKKQGSYRRQ